jgi:sirohydrochlorin ferrochelatase
MARTVREPKKEGIVLLGHGSRVPEAGRNMEKVAYALKEKYGYAVVEVCYMSRLGPHFPEVFRKCVAQGATHIIVIPYFLHGGLHIVHDIPAMMQDLANEYPHVTVIFGNSLGFDSVLVDLVERRISESRALCDVRDVPVPPAERFPIPPGQHEFVPMSPKEAAEYRKRKGSHNS